jgi:hypothetical protein
MHYSIVSFCDPSTSQGYLRIAHFLDTDLFDHRNGIRNMRYRSGLITALDHHTLDELLFLDRLGYRRSIFEILG